MAGAPSIEESEAQVWRADEADRRASGQVVDLGESPARAGIWGESGARVDEIWEGARAQRGDLVKMGAST